MRKLYTVFLGLAHNTHSKAFLILGKQALKQIFFSFKREKEINAQVNRNEKTTDKMTFLLQKEQHHQPTQHLSLT